MARVKTTTAVSVTERDAALDRLTELPGEHRKTVGGDQGFDTFEFVRDCRALNIRPHVTQTTECKGGSAIDGRTTWAMRSVTIETTFS